MRRRAALLEVGHDRGRSGFAAMGLRPAPPVHVDLLAGHTAHHVRERWPVRAAAGVDSSVMATPFSME
ncbi:hypothetical protein [Streptomyces mirabilis]|uniref:hypothetical protein n=1 Tax=Streptomyces mirabilis TaxID=68239 RepID=UPI003624DFCE